MLTDLLKRLWKKSPNPYPKSFGKSLTRRIMLRMLVFMGIPSFILFLISYNAMFFIFVTIGNRMIKGQYEEVRRITSDVYVAAVNTAPVIEDNLDNPDKMLSLMERMVHTNSRIRSCGVSFVADYYPQKGHWFCPYAVRRDSDVVERKILGSKDYNYLNAKWFKEAVARDSSYWSAPFFDNNDQQTPLVSYLIPIHDRQKRVVAVLGVALSLEWFSDKLSFYSNTDTHNEYDPYYFVIDSTGTVLAHPNKNRIVHKKLQDYVTSDPKNRCQEILADRANSSNKAEMEIEGVEAFVTYRPVKYTTWTVALVFPKLLMQVVSYLFGGILLFFIAIGILVVTVSGRNAIRKASYPITLLALSADDVAKGNFKTPLPVLKSRDEIHKLRDSFEKMQQSLAQYTEQLKSTTAEKASIESELNVAHTIQMSMLPKTFPP